jgi:hypothetical protein
MDTRQLDLRLATEEEKVERLREYLRPVGLAPRLVSAACLIVARGDQIQVLGQQAIRLQIAKGEAAVRSAALGIVLSPNTWVAAVQELEERRIVGVLRTTRPWTYVLSLEALARLEPLVDDELAAIARLPLFASPAADDEPPAADRSDDRSTKSQPPVSPRSGARVRETSYSQNPCPPVRRDRARSTQLADRMRRPWDRETGVTGEDLAAAVRTGQLDVLRALWREAKVLEWVGDSDDDLLRFLTAAHHCATVPGLDRRMGALVARVRRYGIDGQIDVSRCRHESEDWAARVMRKHREGVCSERATVDG